MSTPSLNQIFESFVPVYDAVPDTWQEARPFIVEQLRRLANAVNVREIGWLLDEELLSGKAFIPGVEAVAEEGTSQRFRQVLRKVIDFGTLPNAGTKSVLHGILVTADFTLVFLGAYATDPVGLISFPIPYSDPTGLTNAVTITMDVANINITTGTNRTAFTRCYVIVEYLQEL